MFIFVFSYLFKVKWWDSTCRYKIKKPIKKIQKSVRLQKDNEQNSKKVIKGDFFVRKGMLNTTEFSSTWAEYQFKNMTYIYVINPIPLIMTLWQYKNNIE